MRVYIYLVVFFLGLLCLVGCDSVQRVLQKVSFFDQTVTINLTRTVSPKDSVVINFFEPGEYEVFFYAKDKPAELSDIAQKVEKPMQIELNPGSIPDYMVIVVIKNGKTEIREYKT